MNIKVNGIDGGIELRTWPIPVLNDGETSGDAAFRQHNSNGDKREAGEKNKRDDDKNQQPNVRIVHVPMNVRG